MKLSDYTKNKKFVAFFKLYGMVFLVGVLIVISFSAIYLIINLNFDKKLKVSFLNIGQGDAILIQSPTGHDMLIDGGPSDRILEELGEQMNFFDRHIDVVVSTHPDADHITGLIPVFEKYKVDHIVTSPVSGHTGIFDELTKYMNMEQATIHIGVQGDVIDFGDGVIVKILYPPSTLHERSSDTNDASVSVLVMYGGESVLLTGDLSSTYEGRLLSDTLPKGVTIYKAGHHGSKNSSGEELLSYIKPEYAVISAGKNNMYGHPHKETLDRLNYYAKEVVSTIDKGTITFFLDRKTVSIVTEK